MTLRTFLAFASMSLLCICSCKSPGTSADVKTSVSSLQKYAASFKGVSMDEARSRLAGAKIGEGEWREGNYGGKQLIATYPSYEVRVLFSGDKVVTTSVQVLSKGP